MGVEISDFRARLACSKLSPLLPLNISLSRGQVGIITGDVGQGKTSLFQAIIHAREHQGGLTIDGQEAHLYEDRKAIEKKIVYVDTDGSNGRSISWLLASAFVARNPDYCRVFSKSELGGEIALIEKCLREGVPVSSKVRDLICMRREHAKTVVNKFGLTGERTIGTLSSGEKKMVITAITLERAKAFGASLALLDEPVGNLDKKSLEVQINQIREAMPHFAILAISHVYISRLKRDLDAQIIKL